MINILRPYNSTPPSKTGITVLSISRKKKSAKFYQKTDVKASSSPAKTSLWQPGAGCTSLHKPCFHCHASCRGCGSVGRIVVNNKGVVGSIPDSHQFTFGLLVNATYSLYSYTLVRNTVFKTLLLFNVDRVFFFFFCYW